MQLKRAHIPEMLGNKVGGGGRGLIGYILEWG